MVILSWLQYMLFLIWVEGSSAFNAMGSIVITFSSPVFYMNFLMSVVVMALIDYVTYYSHFIYNKNLTNALRIYINDKMSGLNDIIMESLNYYSNFVGKRLTNDYTKIAQKNEDFESDKINKISFKKNLEIFKVETGPKKEVNGKAEENDFIYLKEDR
jgi:hypothetical protein